MGLAGGFGFNHSGVLNPQLQNQFFFPSNDPIGVWGQDSLMVNNSWLMNPMALDPQNQITNPGAQVGMEVASNMNPVGTLGQPFSGMSLNGSMHSLIPALGTPAAMIPVGVPAVPGPTIPPTQPTPVVQPPVAMPPQPEKPKSWAAIASQPAKPKPPPPPAQKHSPEAETSKKQPQNQAWAGQSGGSGRGMTTAASVVSSGNSQGGRGPRRATTAPKSSPVETNQQQQQSGTTGPSEVVSKLKAKNNYNPTELTINMTNARFFVIKSYAEDDVHRAIKYNVWCSTEHGNRRLDGAYRDQKAKGGIVFLFFSVNGSGHFCGVAQMASEIDFGSDTGLWTQDKWKGRFDLKWLYVKDVPNNQLRHIRLENNENKPVTNSRDTQEVPSDKGRTIMKLMHSYNHTTSIFDDFEHYEKRQEEDGPPPSANNSATGSTGSKKVGMKGEGGINYV